MMALTNQNKVYSWGAGQYGILGHGDESGTDAPSLIKDLNKEIIIYIAASQFSSAAINILGNLFIWGQGKFGKSGCGSLENVFNPQKLYDSCFENEKIFMVSLGNYHTLCSSGNYKSYIFY